LGRPHDGPTPIIGRGAIQKYVALNDWQIREIKKAVAEAERGDFASDEDMEKH
jgi:predicted transcriptional regulator